MKTIVLSAKDIINLQHLELPEGTLSTEGGLYTIDLKGSKKVIKGIDSFNRSDKEYTINQLDEIRDVVPRELVIPEAYISNGFVNIGFLLPYITAIDLKTVLNSKNISFEDKILYLRKIGIVLDQLQKIEGFHINDLHESNILVHPYAKMMRFIDLDSCKIANNPSYASKYLSPFSLVNRANKYKISSYGSGYIEADRNSDIYCYINIIINYLTNEDNYGINYDMFLELLNHLNDMGLNKELLRCIELIVREEDNINPYPYLDSLNEELVLSLRKRS